MSGLGGARLDPRIEEDVVAFEERLQQEHGMFNSPGFGLQKWSLQKSPEKRMQQS